MRFLTASILALLRLVTSGCATLFSGNRDEILFTSEPRNVQGVMDGHMVGTKPIMLGVRRKMGGR